MSKKLQTEFFLRDQEVTEERYDEMLGALPPERMTGNAFLVGEPMDHNGEGCRARYELYFTHEGKYFYGGLATVKDFEMWLIPA